MSGFAPAPGPPEESLLEACMIGPRFPWRPWYWGVLVLIVLAIDFALTGVWVIQQNEQGVLLRFGKVVRTCPSGIHFTLPYPVDRMEVVSTTEVRIMPVGFRLVEGPGAANPAQEDAEWPVAQWLTGDTNIVEIEAVLQYIVSDPVAYLFRVADLDKPDGFFEETRHRRFILRKAAESALTTLIARMAVDDVLSSGKAWLQEAARRRTQELVDEFGLGLQLLTVNIQRGSAPAQVIAAFNEVSSAKADRVRAVSEADGYAKDLLPKARARANRIVQEAEIYRSQVVSAARGAAERFRKLAAEVRSSPEISLRRIWLEVVETALARARLVVYPPEPGSEFVLTEIE
ncbi:MAG: FtsH protease activity modulator HflK [Planctomycetota bacterium]